MSQKLLLHVDVLRGRNYPQTEDDPCACSTLVRLFLYNSNLQETIADVFRTGIQENSNAPFYSAGVDFDVPAGLESVVLVVEVEETTRRTEPYVLFYGFQPVSMTGKGKCEEVITLTCTNPVEKPEEAAQEALLAGEDPTSCPVLTIRYQVIRQKNAEEVRDVHADVELPATPALTGATSIVPKGSRYVWVNLTSDPRWTEAFRHTLVESWRDRAPLVGNAVAKESLQASTKGASTSRPSSQPTRLMDIRSIGDVIIKRWCCCRAHEVLTRLRLCAEAFDRGERTIHFSQERELSYRLQRKERVCLLQELAKASLVKMGISELRDTLDHLWIFFSIGIKHDPAGTRVLTYEARKKVREASFDSKDKAILQSSLLNFLVPSLTMDQCNEIAVADMESAERAGNILEETPPTGANFGNNAMSAPASEVDFSMALIEYIGALLDTLTETELVAALKAFEPAVVNAQQRIKAKAKEEITRMRSNFREPMRRELTPYNPGDGIKIDHLDRLGRRKKSYHPR
ncbi:hypothetical protein C3747_280g10 [Trypanosoma cruzi]|uniref:C2 domain-containing protein n=2 Tax=Trypanosoma cruzi TaxID=5693 RepID=Q4D1K2_TRYCC|nr:hypothetical protein, conserved [Trypanosoma cruzi]EAN86401.1 hypothetical protein, conserved [Trypanosoma cruzi]PWU94342.1 hypothetical protein C3747_280g10 [Trypanosoma cruzi]RNC50876.1 hypothetical protein TcCL_ESM12063 [Trypanosoma cruzi]|eukprot:XP_808252.1 hypothetical protein [Trypanosoma cruzi strain CL Brener]